MTDYELVVGIETHVQLKTRTKLFCGCAIQFGAPPNTQVCPICLGHPGSLPVLNRAAFELGLRAALALNCSIAPDTKFDRKNYFYPDLPKNYQISQYDQPFSSKGWVEIETGKKIGITRAHLEEDAGKLIHEEKGTRSFIDLNRTGTPLVEIVTEPDMRSSTEAFDFLTALKHTLEFLDVSTCDMEKGHLRCDANVSVRLKGAERFGVKAEVKNLNSFRFLKQALDYEIARQVGILEGGGAIPQETRLFNPDTGETAGMRSKEHAHDYRYFPEPDLAPLRVSDAWLDEIRAAMPELPRQKRARFIERYGLSEYDADVLTANRPIAEYYEKAATASGEPKLSANWVMGDLMGALNADGKAIADSPVTPQRLGELIALIRRGEISGKMAKEIFPKMFASGEAAPVIMEREGLKQISDTGAIERIIDTVLEQNAKQVEQYKSGKTAVLGFLVGQVMKASRGQANPGTVNEMLRRKLEG